MTVSFSHEAYFVYSAGCVSVTLWRLAAFSSDSRHRVCVTVCAWVCVNTYTRMCAARGVKTAAE